LANPEAILSEHYKAVREEEMERLRHRDQYLILYVTGIGIIAGFYLRDQRWWGLVLIVPVFSALVALLYAHTDVTLGALSNWLRYRYTDMLRQYQAANALTYALEHWDGSTLHAAYIRSISFGWRYVVVSALLGLTSASATQQIWIDLTIVAKKGLVACIAVSFIAPLWAWRCRILPVSRASECSGVE
jgi:hypothetical protein